MRYYLHQLFKNGTLHAKFRFLKCFRAWVLAIHTIIPGLRIFWFIVIWFKDHTLLELTLGMNTTMFIITMVYAAIKVPIGIYLLHFFRPLTQFLTALKRSDDFEGEKFDDTPRYPRKTTKKSKTKSSEKKQDNLPHYQIKFNRWRARQEGPENKKESNEMQEKKMPPPCNKQESLGYDVVNPFRSYH